MPEYSSLAPESGDDWSDLEAGGERAESLLPELEALEGRLQELAQWIRSLREENNALRSREAELLRERETLWRERGLVSARLTEIIAKVDAVRGET